MGYEVLLLMNSARAAKSLPFAFTEYGAVALANVLASAQDAEMGIYVVRAFVPVRMRIIERAQGADRQGGDLRVKAWPRTRYLTPHSLTPHSLELGLDCHETRAPIRGLCVGCYGEQHKHQQSN